MSFVINLGEGWGSDLGSRCWNDESLRAKVYVSKVVFLTLPVHQPQITQSREQTIDGCEGPPAQSSFESKANIDAEV